VAAAGGDDPSAAPEAKAAPNGGALPLEVAEAARSGGVLMFVSGLALGLTRLVRRRG
jgi:hypothetical protein